MGNDNIGNVGCKIRTANTAESRCRLDLGLYRVAVITPLNAKFTGLDAQGQPQTFVEWINEGIHAANPTTQRFYPMPEIRGVEDASKDEGVFTDDYGEDTTLFDGTFGFTQKFRPDACLNKRLFQFNNQQFRVIIFDNQNNAQVIRSSDGIHGEQIRIFVTSPKANTASEISQPTIKFAATKADEHQRREVIPTDLNWGEIKGLEDVVMNVVTDGGNSVITFNVDCGGDDVTGELAVLSGEATAWLKQVGDATPVPLTPAPTYDAEKNVFEATGLTTGNKIGIANPSVLYGLGVTNIECADMAVV